jgi:cytidylate kinase
MNESFDIPNIRIITISGRIASGSTTLAKKLSEALKWQRMEGGDIFWEAVRKKMNLSPKDTALRPDEEDLLFEKKQKEILENDKHLVLESKLAGFVGKDIKGLFRILVICEDTTGADQTQIRIDRLVNREGISVDEAKSEVLEREKNDVEKWRRLYADNDPEWTYWNHKYYDLVINTFSHNEDDSLNLVLDKIGIQLPG